MSDLLSYFDALLATDAVMPSQFYDPRPVLTPERRLVVAILEDALRTVVKGKFLADNISHVIGGKERMLADDIKWFASRARGVGSFEWVCEVLGLDEDYIRGQIERRGSVALGSGHRTIRSRDMGRKVPITSGPPRLPYRFASRQVESGRLRIGGSRQKDQEW